MLSIQSSGQAPSGKDQILFPDFRRSTSVFSFGACTGRSARLKPRSPLHSLPMSDLCSGRRCVVTARDRQVGPVPIAGYPLISRFAVAISVFGLGRTISILL